MFSAITSPEFAPFSQNFVEKNGGRVQPKQLQLGEVDIAGIQFDLRSRDDIPQLLRGLQYLYTEEAIRQEVFQVLEEVVPDDVDEGNGRPGMSLWRILPGGTEKLTH